MPGTNLLSFVNVLRENHFLSVAEMTEVNEQLLHRCIDARNLARLLMQRGWLTVYQANRLFRGEIRNLIWGDYRILDRLGQGGSSQVYKARHVPSGRIVALKTLIPGVMLRAEAVEQFEWESEVLGRIHHTNIVEFLEAGRIDGVPYCVTEYLDGTDLGKLLKLSGRLPIDRACAYAQQTARALEAAHQAGLVHRDVKPANLFLLVNATATEPCVKLIDWGLACWQHDSGLAQRRNSPASSEGALLGTADYLAPEQIRNADEVDIRADVYALGCTLYHLLAGQPPFPGVSLMQKLLQHQNDPPKDPREFRPEIPASLSEVVLRMLAKQPGERFQRPIEAALQLEPFSRL